MEEIEKLENEESRWHPVYGNTYTLDIPSHNKKKKVNFFGIIQNRKNKEIKFIFYGEEKGEVYRYISYANSTVIWFGDLDEGPYEALIKASPGRRLNDGLEKDHILKVLEKMNLEEKVSDLPKT
ncbi:MAG: hypothetical protein QGF74_02090 [Candidatus Nanoarchaeia archaeon]|jgi:hypothetical protein|nr:hypothetical protein [Candidatus Nanoarchaeia archaeon]|tara:strand:+ start:57331 stop:57702 length:372 start_codon:yes stop_codon:yes gene_type:complete